MQAMSFYWVDLALCIDEPGVRALHQHHAIQLTFGMEDTFDLAGAGEHLQRREVVLIAPDVPHRVQGEMVHLLVDPESELGLRLQGVLSLHDSGIVPLALDLSSSRSALADLVGARAPKGAARALCDSLLASVLQQAGNPPPRRLDSRVVHTLARLRAVPGRRVPLDVLAEEVGLSPHRLRHLFREEVGLPLREYVLWLRSVAAVVEISQGAAMAQAAQTSGFADHAAMSRTHKRTWGRPPSSYSRMELPQKAAEMEVAFRAWWRRD